MLHIRQATADDVPAVLSIMTEAAEWLTARGATMWRTDELRADRIAEDVAAGQFYVACDGATPVGTLKFQLSDPIFWPDVPDGDSAFVHRLAVRRSHAGGRVSTALLAWARDRAASLGRAYLRLDTEASRTRLCAVYERFGFVHHSHRQVGPYFVARYEMDLRQVGTSST